MPPRRRVAGRFILAAASWLLLAPAANAQHGPVAPPPVILIVVDTLRADRLGTYGDLRFVTPELDAFARGGVVFERAYATSPWTLPTFGSIFTGVLPARHRAGAVLEAEKNPKTGKAKVLLARADPALPTLPALLRRHGYLTHAVAGNPNLHPKFGLAEGFDRYDFFAGDQVRIRRADVIVDRALTWLARWRGAPFFLFLHFFDPHTNYDPPPPVRGRFTNGQGGRFSLPFVESQRVRLGKLQLTDVEQRFVSGAYDEEVAFVDLQLGRLFAGLEAAGLRERAIIVLTADHGEEFWDHGGFEHGHTMYDELLRVPLIVWGPGVPPGRVAEPVSLVDLAPTVLDAVGAAPPAETKGISLWPRLTTGAPVPRRTLFAEGSLYADPLAAAIDWPFKAVFNLKTGDERLYNLADDAAERVNLRRVNEAVLAHLRQQYRDRPAVVAQQAHPTPMIAKIDAATREQLRALGYVE